MDWIHKFEIIKYTLESKPVYYRLNNIDFDFVFLTFIEKQKTCMFPYFVCGSSLKLNCLLRKSALRKSYILGAIERTHPKTTKKKKTRKKRDERQKTIKITSKRIWYTHRKPRALLLGEGGGGYARMCVFYFTAYICAHMAMLIFVILCYNEYLYYSIIKECATRRPLWVCARNSRLLEYFLEYVIFAIYIYIFICGEL